MKAKMLAISVMFLFLMIGLAGCDELEKLDEPNYIIVTVSCKAEFYALEDGEKLFIDDGLVRLEIIKAGGEKVSDLQAVIGGNTESITGTFNVYKEQPIECIGTIILGSVDSYTQYYTFNSGYHIITWDEIDAQADFGDTITKDVTVEIVGIKNN